VYDLEIEETRTESYTKINTHVFETSSLLFHILHWPCCSLTADTILMLQS